MGMLILRGPIHKMLNPSTVRSVPGFPDQKKLRVADLAVLINIHLIQALLRLGHLVLDEPGTGLDHFKHFG